MDFAKLIPYGAGSAPAVVLGFTLYQQMLAVTGEDFSGPVGFIACVAVFSVMAGEIVAYESAFKAFAKREMKAGIAAFIAAMCVTGLVGFGVWTGSNTRALITTLVAAVLVYIVFGLMRYVSTRAEVVQEVKHDTEAERAYNLKMAEIEKNKANAEARKAKAQAGGASIGRPIVSTGQTGQKALNPEYLAVAVAYWEKDKSASASSWVEDPDCPIKSRETARHYKAAALEVIAKKEGSK